MFEEGQLLYFEPFFFKNGNPDKNKYFVVLKVLSDEILLASLPTSQDHLPSAHATSSGCISDAGNRINAFVFNGGEPATETSFAFPLRTYIYGEQLDDYPLSVFEMWRKLGKSRIHNKGKLLRHLYDELVGCLKASSVVKRKYRRML